MLTMTREQARRFLLSRQGLLGAYRLKGKEGALQYVRQAGCIQYDPVDVCGRNAELTLQSRVKGFSRQMLSDLLYKDRLLIDYCDKELAIWAREDWPYFAPYRERSRAHGKQFEGLEELEEQAVAYIRAHGPVSSDELPIAGEIFWHSSMHWSGNWDRKSQAARSVLEQLYTDGRLLIHHKSGSRKYYDLADNYLDRDLLEAQNPCPDRASCIQWRLARRIGAIGLLWNRRSDAYLGIDMTTDEREETFEDMEEAGRIIRVQVEGVRFPLFLLREDLPLLEQVLSDCVDRKPRLEFLAPLDPMLWDRKLIEAVWDYQYSWEIYTPREKRRYGYYVLPILYGEKLIGRIEAVAERKTGTLQVRNIWYEPGVRQTKKLQTALDAAIRRFAGFNDCKIISRSEGDGE